jgi:competence protein ComGC
MDTSTIIWIVVLAVLLLVVVGLVVALMNKRRNEHNRAKAELIRTQAVTHTADLTESQRRAEEAEAEARIKQAEAERAEERAARAKQGHLMEEAHHEDRLREADRIDPDVDHRADDYAPGTTSAPHAAEETTTATPTTHESGTVPPATEQGTVPPPTEPGTHRA